MTLELGTSLIGESSVVAYDRFLVFRTGFKSMCTFSRVILRPYSLELRVGTILKTALHRSDLAPYLLARLLLFSMGIYYSILFWSAL